MAVPLVPVQRPVSANKAGSARFSSPSPQYSPTAFYYPAWRPYQRHQAPCSTVLPPRRALLALSASNQASGSNNAPTKGLSFLNSVVSGGLAGMIEIACMYPTDVVKTRVQLSTSANAGLFKTLMRIARQEGVGVLYRGIFSPLFAEAPKRATKFACNEEYKKLVRCQDGSLPPTRAFAAGALAGFTEAIVNCPFETLKVRMQAKENKALYKNELDCLIKIRQNEGLLSLFQGLSAQMLRNMSWNGTYFAIIGSASTLFPTSPDDSHAKRLGLKFVSGLIGGVCGTVFATPFDVIKSRMQNQGAGHVNPAYRNVASSMVAILKDEGFRALYKGFGPRIVRLGPGGGIMIVAFDTISTFLKDYV